MGRKSSQMVENIVQQMAKGKPYVFVIMSYKEKWSVFERVQKIVKEVGGVECFRADHVKASGHDLLAKIHLLIERAIFVIAEISLDSPNVFYEIGYTAAIQRPILLIKEKKKEVPTDLKGLEVIEYEDTPDSMHLFDQNLSEHVKLRISLQISLLRDMIEAEKPKPAYIFASPKIRSADSDIVPDERTFGDNLGILGLISAFGTILGEDTGIELVSAQSFSKRLLDETLNLYFIGSPMVNPAVEEILEKLQKGREPNFMFALQKKSGKADDSVVALFQWNNGRKRNIKGSVSKRDDKGFLKKTSDYGIIVRGPHPKHKDRIMMVMAGIHSLGTGAACLAATRSPLIEKINAAMPEGKDIAHKDETIWVLVKGENDEKDGHLYLDGVTIVGAGVYE